MAKMCYRPVLGSTVNGLEQPITVSNSNNSISSEISQSNANTQSILPLSNEHETNDDLDYEFLISINNRENHLSNGEVNSVNVYNSNSLSNTSLDINQSNNFVAASSANNHYNEFANNEFYNSSSNFSTNTIYTYPSWFQSNAFGYPNLNNYYQQNVYNQQFSNLNGEEMNHDDQQVNPGSLSNPVELNQQILYPSYCDATQSSSSVSNADWSPNGSNLSANDGFENTEMITPINDYSNSPNSDQNGLNIGLNQDFMESQFALLSESNKQLKNNKVHKESKPITVLPKKREAIKISSNSKSIAQNAIPMISNTGYYNMPIRTIRKRGRNGYHIYDYVMEIFYNPGEIARRIRSKDPNMLKELEDLGLEIDKLFLWLDQEKGIFKVLQPEFVAFIWAFIKGNLNWCWKRFLKSIQLRDDFKNADMDEGFGKWHVLQFNRRL